MALALVWTKRAIRGYDKIVRYLEQHWTDKEVRNFIHESDEFYTLLSQYPELLKRRAGTRMFIVVRMNKLTVITYRVKPRKHQIELINIRGGQTEHFEIGLSSTRAILSAC